MFRLKPLTLIVFCLGLLTACSSGAGKTEDLSPQLPGQARRQEPLLAASGLNVVPSSLQFSEQRVGTTSAPQVVTLRNTGAETLFVSDSTITGPFAVSPSGPLTLEPGTTQELLVTFSPTTRGAADGTLGFSSNDSFNPRVTLYLSGQGVTPVEVTPGSLDFGAQRVGTTSPAQRVMVRNTGSASLTVTSVSTTSGPFAASSPALPFTVPPGASQELSVTFSPTAVGAASGTLALTTDDPGSPSVSVPLSGQGVKPTIAVSTTALDFGEQRVGSTSSPLRVTVRNTGSGNLVVTNVSTTSGPFAAASPALPFTVAPGASQELSVTFSPTSEGAFSGTLSVSSDDADTPSVSIALSGTAVNPALEVSPTRLVFSASNVGVSAADQEVHVHNPGGTAQRISSVSFSGTAAPDFSVAPPTVFPVTVSPGGTVSLALRFTPGAVGSREAQATFAFDATGQGPAVVELVGEGTSPLVAVTPGRLDFGTWRRGEAVAPLSARIQNTGTGPLTLSRVTLSGADAARFSLAPVSLPRTLAPEAFVDLTVRLNPDAVRTFSATLAVESDDVSHPRVEVPLSGKAVGSYLSVEPSSWDFAQVEVGSRGEPRTFTVTNGSSSPRTVDHVEATSAAFEVQAGGLLATPLAPGGSASFQVLFHPESAGPASGEVRLTLREESTPDAVLAVSGTGDSPAAPASGCSCDGGGGSSAAAGLALLALLALSGRRAHAAPSSGQR